MFLSICFTSKMNEIPRMAVKGRGAVGAPKHRFTTRETHAVDDGWWRDADEEKPKLKTTLTADRPRRIITRNSSPDVYFDRSINPYQGCEHGCIYCFARPTHSYFNLSPGLDFESKIFFKPNAARMLESELANPRYKCAPIALGINTDAYQPAEDRLEVTRSILKVLSAHNHPVSIITKSARVVRDLDILADMARRDLVHVTLSITTLDPAIARTMEPRASAPAKRLAAVQALAEAGITVGVNVAPVIPGLTDMDHVWIFVSVGEAGATEVVWILLRLPLEVKGMFIEWLNTHFPDRASKVLSLIRQTREGGLYQSEWGKRMTGSGPYADLIRQRALVARRRFGLDRKHIELDCTRFAPPPKAGDQLRLF
jgi:DNA repair photolyase